MKPIAVAGVILLSTGLSACSKSSPTASAQESAQAPSTASPTASPTTSPPGAASTPDPNRATAVEFARLVALVPELHGWTRNQPRGEQVSIGVPISKAEAEYANGDSIIKLSITDSTLDPLVLAPLGMILKPTYSERAGENYKRYAAFSGQPGCESWQHDANDAEVTVIVASRFVVNARGLNMPGIEPVQSLVKAIDIAKLAAMR